MKRNAKNQRCIVTKTKSWTSCRGSRKPTSSKSKSLSPSLTRCARQTAESESGKRLTRSAEIGRDLSLKRRASSRIARWGSLRTNPCKTYSIRLRSARCFASSIMKPMSASRNWSSTKMQSSFQNMSRRSLTGLNSGKELRRPKMSQTTRPWASMSPEVEQKRD